MSAPQHLFKVILVGNSSVGKTALLHRFCDGHFRSDTTATVGESLSLFIITLVIQVKVKQLIEMQNVVQFSHVIPCDLLP